MHDLQINVVKGLQLRTSIFVDGQISFKFKPEDAAKIVNRMRIHVYMVNMVNCLKAKQIAWLHVVVTFIKLRQLVDSYLKAY